MVAQEDATQAQVERILNSTTLRNAEVLRRLFKFLAEKSLAGEADHLKEYIVGVDAFGKPPGYDPRQDSVVRIQMGRLRHKIADYYKDEGKDDLVLIDVPKGHFKITWQTRPPAPAEPSAPVPSPIPPFSSSRWPKPYWIAIVLLGAWSLLSTALWLRQYRDAAPLREAWSPDLQELWAPLLDSGRPLIVSVATPLLVGFQGHGLFRAKALNTWDDALASPEIQAIRKALNNPSVVERYDYTGAGEMRAAFQLGKLLNFTGHRITTVRSSQITWQQLVDNNVLFVGAPRVFGDPFQKLPVDMDFVLREDGVHDRKAPAGQPSVFADNYRSISGEAVSTPDDGEIYALVNRLPGPLALTDVQMFVSNYSPGTLGAINWFTTPALARDLTARLRKPDGHLPRYFQLVLQVKYRDGVPTEISYVTHRELQAQRASH